MVRLQIFHLLPYLLSQYSFYDSYLSICSFIIFLHASSEYTPNPPSNPSDTSYSSDQTSYDNEVHNTPYPRPILYYRLRDKRIRGDQSYEYYHRILRSESCLSAQ